MGITCTTCQLDPCVCKYLGDLEAGKFGSLIPEVAKIQARQPQPHRGGCPCPFCYSTRLKTFRRTK